MRLFLLLLAVVLGCASGFEVPAGCKKDLLLIVDASFTVTRENFNKGLKKFLKDFVTDEKLDVRRNGTQVALITFSTSYKTKSRINFRDIYDAKALADNITGIKWHEVSGYRTRTDLALKKANEVFSSSSPANNRVDVDDVVVLITDGNPAGHPGGDQVAINEAIKYSKQLKKKGILIVGVAVGPKPDDFIDTIIKLAKSEEYVEKAGWQGINNIRDKLISSSCYEEAEKCECSAIRREIYVKADQSKVEVSWPEPEICQNGYKPTILSKTVEPPVTSPQEFPIGNNTITYTYKLKGGQELSCPVIINVKVIPCHGQDYDPHTEICCCGKLWTKKPGWKCCGMWYHDGQMKCCTPNYNLVSMEKPCPGE